MASRSFVPRFGRWLGGLVALMIAFVAVMPSAHAAPLVGADLGGGWMTGLVSGLATELGAEVVGMVDGLGRAVAWGGGLCLDGLHTVGVTLGLDPHASRDAVACTDLRGVGFAFLGLAAVVVIAVSRMRLATEQRRLDVARRLIENGLQPPEGLFTAPARRDLRKGVVLVFAGLGLVVTGMMLGDRGMAAGGLIPAFIGIGYLVSHRLATAEAAADRERSRSTGGVTGGSRGFGGLGSGGPPRDGGGGR